MNNFQNLQQQWQNQNHAQQVKYKGDFDSAHDELGGENLDDDDQELNPMQMVNNRQAPLTKQNYQQNPINQQQYQTMQHDANDNKEWFGQSIPQAEMSGILTRSAKSPMKMLNINNSQNQQPLQIEKKPSFMESSILKLENLLGINKPQPQQETQILMEQQQQKQPQQQQSYIQRQQQMYQLAVPQSNNNSTNATDISLPEIKQVKNNGYSNINTPQNRHMSPSPASPNYQSQQQQKFTKLKILTKEKAGVGTFSLKKNQFTKKISQSNITMAPISSYQTQGRPQSSVNQQQQRPPQSKVVRILDKSGNEKQKVISVIGKGDIANMRQTKPLGQLLTGSPQRGFASSKGVNLRLRSGSPGSRVNHCQGLIKNTLNSPDPKQYLKNNFKDEMQQLGLAKDMKKLKSFKFCLMSRSQDNLQNTQSTAQQKAGDSSPVPDEEEDKEFETLYAKQDPSIQTLVHGQSQSTTLERTDIRNHQSSIQHSQVGSSIQTNGGGKMNLGVPQAILPFQRRQLNRMRSASPPKPNLKLCTENYIVYS